ncbi:WAS/WASL-interacting protein family member 1 isoform X3 [Spodoptera frugiperda]|uniref:WAS/WASL-interacting protein family member 1 isoform X3 n=1 Tax=Spodoptera frugiperda TaxID=7108 RepID=A0A9R0F6R9_SPOFR|nr:WAS/WASL-interacting protein family member 1 isoform X3 [Spodoptera frugiperda]
MVIKTMSISKPGRVVPLVRSDLNAHHHVSRRPRRTHARVKREAESEAGDVIDLGAPRLLLRRTAADPRQPGRPRTRPPYTPNPRLYPGPRPKPKPRPKRAEARGNEGRGRRRNRVFRRPVPNARLYRPAPPRPPPPPAWPRATWPPPVPGARLETASRVALRFSEQRRGSRAPQRSLRATVRAECPPARAARSPARRPSPVAAQPSAAGSLSQPSRRLVVTLPAPPSGSVSPPPRYRPASEHFRLRSQNTESGTSTPVAGRRSLNSPPLPAAPAMDTGNRHSTSPEDCSDGNETLSAPSEFLAEFLSAIMRRQYAEALKYCRLILQYEPHNATARGFYPLLQHKLRAQPPARRPLTAPPAPGAMQEMMEQGADDSDGPASGSASRSSSRSRGSCASQSSLELDSSDALAHSSASASLSRRTEHSDTECVAGAAGCWESTGSEDDNGNAAAAGGAGAGARAADVHNDNVPRADSAASLRRLRAQFTCSIK